MLPQSRRAVRVGISCSPGAPARRAAAAEVVRAVGMERKLVVTRAVVARVLAMEAARVAETAVAAPEVARGAAKAVVPEVARAAALMHLYIYICIYIHKVYSI